MMFTCKEMEEYKNTIYHGDCMYCFMACDLVYFMI